MNKKPQYYPKSSLFLKAILLIVTFQFIFTLNNSFSQSITWQRTYSKNIEAIGNDACQTADGNFVTVGSTTVLGVGIGIIVLKFNNFGDTIWIKTIVLGSGFPVRPYTANAVTATIDSGIVLAGSGDSTFLIKINQYGNVVWQKFYPSYSTQCYNIIRTDDGGYISCGRNTSFNSEGYVIKVNSSGMLLWERIYNNYLGAFNSIENTSGGYIIAGDTYNGSSDTTKAIIIKINDTGDTLWSKKYKINNRSSIAKKIKTIQNNYLIIGGTIDSINTEQFYLLKTDSSGNITYSKTFIEGNYDNYINDFMILGNNRFVFVYERYSPINPILNAVSIITDSLGNISKKNVFTKSPYFIWGSLRKIIPVPNGDILFVGTAKLDITFETVIYAVRTDSNLNTPPYIGINNINNHVPENFYLRQNYPNPFNNSTKIVYTLKEKSKVKIDLFDINGRLMITLINRIYNVGDYDLIWKPGNAASGVYFLRMTINNSNSQIIKMILIK